MCILDECRNGKKWQEGKKKIDLFSLYKPDAYINLRMDKAMTKKSSFEYGHIIYVSWTRDDDPFNFQKLINVYRDSNAKLIKNVSIG